LVDMADEERSQQTDKLAAEAGSSLAVVEKTYTRFLKTSGVNQVYGKPVEKDDIVIIPAAEVMSGIGFGVGHGYGVGDDEEGGASGMGGGEGGGGGGRTFSRPVAVVVASQDGVRVEPIVDPTKILLAAITAGGFMAAMILRIVSPRRALREMKADSVK
jgi:uncharacterized spore protein YtfJ